MRGSNGELTSPTTYAPMQFRFTSVGTPPLLVEAQVLLFHCMRSNRLNMTTKAGAALSAVSDRDCR